MDQIFGLGKTATFKLFYSLLYFNEENALLVQLKKCLPLLVKNSLPVFKKHFLIKTKGFFTDCKYVITTSHFAQKFRMTIPIN